jgi:hypothetical protein
MSCDARIPGGDPGREPVARFMLWGAVAAWILVAASFVVRLIRRRKGPVPARGAGFR